jgi:RNA polymerase sigma-70 factor (ECF subfamily)
MSQAVRERAQWLARNVLPHEPVIRTQIKRVRVTGLDIDDVVQEMYARILSVPSLESIRYPRQYAIQTARGIIIDYLRRSRVVSIVASGSLEQLDAVLPERTTEERLEFQGEIEEVASALADLPDTWRETLILRRIEGLSQKETARRLGVAEKTVEKYMAKGAMMLVELFGRGGNFRAHSSKLEDDPQGSKDGTFGEGDC